MLFRKKKRSENNIILQQMREFIKIQPTKMSHTKLYTFFKIRVQCE